MDLWQSECMEIAKIKDSDISKKFTFFQKLEDFNKMENPANFALP